MVTYLEESINDPFDSEHHQPDYNFVSHFPALTHLTLFSIYGQDLSLGLVPNQLEKLSIYSVKPGLDLMLATLIHSQSESLRSVRLGDFDWRRSLAGQMWYAKLGEALESCTRLKDFRLVPGESVRLATPTAERSNAKAELGKFGHLLYVPAMRGPWRYSLEVSPSLARWWPRCKLQRWIPTNGDSLKGDGRGT
jgi:hypothetical protein